MIYIWQTGIGAKNIPSVGNWDTISYGKNE